MPARSEVKPSREGKVRYVLYQICIQYDGYYQLLIQMHRKAEYQELLAELTHLMTHTDVKHNIDQHLHDKAMTFISADSHLKLASSERSKIDYKQQHGECSPEGLANINSNHQSNAKRMLFDTNVLKDAGNTPKIYVRKHNHKLNSKGPTQESKYKTEKSLSHCKSVQKNILVSTSKGPPATSPISKHFSAKSCNYTKHPSKPVKNSKKTKTASKSIRTASKEKCRQPTVQAYSEQGISASTDRKPQIFNRIELKSQEVATTKYQLECKIAYIQQAVEKERQKLANSNRQVSYISQEINDLTQDTDLKKQQNFQLRKKAQNITNELKTLSRFCRTTHKQIEKVTDSKIEEQQLIDMYRTVIKELKSQLKIQKSQKNECQHKLAQLRKNEKVIRVKSKSRQNSSKELLERVQKSVQKWY